MAIHKIDGVDGDNNFPKKFVTLYCTGAVTKGDWVVIDLADTTNGRGASVKQYAGSSLDATAFGIATETKTAAGNLVVQTAGLCDFANMTGSVAAGAALACDTTAGKASTAAGGDASSPCGIYITSDGSSASVDAATNRVIIADQGYF